MSFGQGGPRWGGDSESQNQNPYGATGDQQAPGQDQGAYGQGAQPLPAQEPWRAPENPGGAGGLGGPGGFAGPGDSGTPDWSALADASEARGRRKRWFMIGGIALATCAVGAIVATAVVSAGGGTDKQADDPTTAQSLPPLPGPSSPEPSFSSVAPKPPPNPKDFIDSAAKDTAPISAETLFPGKTLTIDGHTYAKGATSDTKSCASGTQGALGAALTSNGCTQLVRATYSRDGIAVTVGIAVFDHESQATTVRKQEPGGNVASLAGAGVPTFCRVTVCRSTTNAYGRYGYFTEGGFETRRAVTTKDKAVYTAGDDISDFAFRQIVARGQRQASAAAQAENNG